MKHYYIYGDADSYLAIPVRISATSKPIGAERLWAELLIDNSDEFLRLIGKRLHATPQLEKQFDESAQHVIEAARWLLDDGELADREFRLDMFDWHVPNTVTTLARSPMPS